MTTLMLHADHVCNKHHKICPKMHQAKALSEFFCQLVRKNNYISDMNENRQQSADTGR